MKLFLVTSLGKVVENIHVMHQTQCSGGSQDALNKRDAIINSVTFQNFKVILSPKKPLNSKPKCPSMKWNSPWLMEHPPCVPYGLGARAGPGEDGGWPPGLGCLGLTVLPHRGNVSPHPPSPPHFWIIFIKCVTGSYLSLARRINPPLGGWNN